MILGSELFEVLVQPSPTDERGVVEWTLRHAKQAWTIRSQVPELASARTYDTPTARAILERNLSWRSPFLFIREDSGNREGSRALVDHVFKCEGPTVVRLGTLAAPTGVPGSQFADGRFRDAYDRLEFSPLAAPDKGPVFPIFLQERNGRFRADTEATWRHNLPAFEKSRNELRGLQNVPAPTPSAQGSAKAPNIAAQRSARAAAFAGLAIARYCERETEFNEVLKMARQAVDPVDELIQEIETVVPGELAASRDEILRANPALVNFFKESSDETPEPVPVVPPPPLSEPPALTLPRP